MDGGFAWNVPLLQAVEMGATEIYVLAVVATALPFRRSFRGLPDFLFRLADVMWRTLGNVGYVTTRIDPDGTYRGVPVTVIHPTEEHAGFNLRHAALDLARAQPTPDRRRLPRREARAQRGCAGRARRRAPRAETGLEVEPAFRHEVA